MEWHGEKLAWDFLQEQNPVDVQTRALTTFDENNSTYKLTCLDQILTISLTDRSITSKSNPGKHLLTVLGEFSRLSILRYLVHAKDILPSGELVRPSDLPGGDIFLRGTHVLPLDRLTDCFENNFRAFSNKGSQLGATHLDYGDMSLRLFPFPRVPIVLILWSADEEFPPRSSLLFDSSCLSHLSTDILWSTAMMSLGMMLAI